MHSRRAVLYIPGDDRRKIEKGAGLEVDSLCLDMEDGVAANRKLEARTTVVEALQQLDFGSSERLVRVNPVGSGLEREDLQAALAARPDGLVLPKVEEPGEILWAGQQITDAEQLNHWPEGQIALIAIVESARGILNLKEIAGADPRLQALVFGAEDFAGDVGMTRTRDNWEVFYARSALVTTAAAFNLQAIDMVYVDFKDTEGLRREAESGAQLGFSGKQVIHPDQIEPVQSAFTPDDRTIAEAVRLMAAFEEHQKAGKGAFALDGKMVDAPMMKAARRVLERARAAGKI